MSDEPEFKNFLCIPVSGNINKGGRTWVDQRPIEELRPMLQAVLDDSFIVEFGWKQYTPYFNDGEPCEFTVHTPWVRTTADMDVEETYQLELHGHPTLDSSYWGHKVEGGPYEKIYRERTAEVIASAERCLALADAIEGGPFERVLLESFGDHAEISVTKTGIQIKFYEHE
jgi:hypothetical protein